MNLPELARRAPRQALIAGAAAAALILVAVLIAGGGGEGDNRAAVVPTTALGDFDTPTAVPGATETPEPGPTEVAVTHRTNCAEIRGTAYQSDEERAWFQQNCSGTGGGSGSGGTVSGPIRGSNDRLIMPRLGINAPVNYRTVGTDGQLGDPAGPYDVVWYDFANFPSFGGYPGEGGSNAVLAGHVDYRTVGAAVFYQLRNVNLGDIIQYRRGDGLTITYAVTGVNDILPGANWDPLVAKGAGEAITLITCNGEFNYTTREYSHRRVVRAVRQ